MEVDDRKALVDAVRLLLSWRDLNAYPRQNLDLLVREKGILEKAEATLKKLNEY